MPELREEERDDDEEGGLGEVAVATSIVAISSLLATGAPHDEQNRMASDSSTPHEKHLAMAFPATGYLRPQPRTS